VPLRRMWRPSGKLRSLGCDQAPGYHVATPFPITAIDMLLTTGRLAATDFALSHLAAAG
jgi:hypothetical protein